MARASRVPALGQRGGGWVALQFLLLGAVVACGFAGVYWPGSVEAFLPVLGLFVALAGVVLLGAGVLELGRSLTPFPRPHPRGELRQSGVYRLARHPIYGGILLLATGWSLAEAPLGLVPTALLAAVFDLKARREEAWLEERFPDYAAYRARTPRRFLPWLY